MPGAPLLGRVACWLPLQSLEEVVVRWWSCLTFLIFGMASFAQARPILLPTSTHNEVLDNAIAGDTKGV